MSVQFSEVRAVRIMCDGVLKNRILDQLIKFGANGYTWWQAHGKGQHETIADVYTGLDRIYIEVWCDADVAENIVAYCQGSQFRGVGMTCGMEALQIHQDEAAKFKRTAR